ncbi:MAG: hypothetical protein LBD16_04440 [Oscillospiraceae bacterium]|jgi:hypothetical protein|nr:hypothetical protein [Oscillospiraceae bacterium]
MATYTIIDLAGLKDAIDNQAYGDVFDIQADIKNDGTLSAADLIGEAGNEISINGNGHKIDMLDKQLFGTLEYVNMKDVVIAGSSAFAITEADNSTFTNVTVDGQALVNTATDCEFIGCVSDGNRNVVSAAASLTIGGIVFTAENCRLYKCVNNGNISVEMTATGAGIYAGGIAGIVMASRSTVVSCENYGAISVVGNGNVSFVVSGGIVGEVWNMDFDTTNEFLVVADNVNAGEVTASGAKSDIFSGGITGDLSVGGLLINNVNTCQVSSGATSEPSIRGSQAGGIAGHTENSHLIENFDAGSVISAGLAGGITAHGSDVTAEGNIVCAKLISGEFIVGGFAGEAVSGASGPGITIKGNYVNVSSFSGAGCGYRIIGYIEDRGNPLEVGENYYEPLMAEPSGTGVQCTAGKIEGDPEAGEAYDSATHTFTNGDRLTGCMRAVWNKPASCNRGSIAGTQTALTGIVSSVASIEGGLTSVIKANLCILKNALENAESQDEIDKINDAIQELLTVATGVEDGLKGRLTTSTELMTELIGKCDGCVGSNGLCCVPLYLAADGTRVPAQGVQLEVVQQGTNKAVDDARTITDGEGKVYLELEPGSTYIVTMHSEGDWEDATFTVTVDSDCNAKVGNGVESVCCDAGCAVTVYRPGFDEPEYGSGDRPCGGFIPFAPICTPDNSSDKCPKCRT